MKLITRHSRRTSPRIPAAARRIIAAAVVVISFVILAVETALHARGIAPYAAPFLVFACGLEYLRSTHRWRS